MREEELEFLGMKFTKRNEDVDEEKLRTENRRNKKLIQKEYEKDLEDMRIKLNKELRDSETKDIENEEYDRVWDLILE